MKTCITHCTVHTGEAILMDKNIVIEDGIITGITGNVPAGAVLHDLEGLNVSAGFIDIQVNGGEKYHFTKTPTEAALQDICESSFQYGVTHLLPCLISSPHTNILQAIDVVKNFMRHNKAVIGLHLEGPFINPAKRGAHPQANIRPPADKELEEIITRGKGVVKLMTIAPECFSDRQILLLQQSGIVLAAGHSALTCTQAQHHFANGITLVTHLYNAMTQFGHREPGLVGATLDNSRVYAPIILDGQHCDYTAARVAHKAKPGKLFLISDAAFLSRKIKQFEWGEFNMKLMPDGHYRNAEGNLAGASISMAEAVKNAKNFLEIPAGEAVKMASAIPAKAIGCDGSLGFIREGYPAKFVCFDDTLETITPLAFS